MGAQTADSLGQTTVEKWGTRARVCVPSWVSDTSVSTTRLRVSQSRRTPEGWHDCGDPGCWYRTGYPLGYTRLESPALPAEHGRIAEE